MAISRQIQTIIRENLEHSFKQVCPNVICINESKSSSGIRIPYTKTLDENLMIPLNESGLFNNYTEKAKNEMRAITSSSTLTYNTFCITNKSVELEIEGTTYFKFIPESKRHPLNFNKKSEKGKANIDAELISKNKVLMIEMKMFEPYYFNPSSTLKRLEKYKDANFYDNRVFTPTQITAWISLFEYYEKQINLKRITQFDVMQILKHLLSILNNQTDFGDNCKIELWAVTWHASLSSLNLGSLREVIMRYDDTTIRQTDEAIAHINDFIKQQDYNNVRVYSDDYSNFILRTNINKYEMVNKYLQRYI